MKSIKPWSKESERILRNLTINGKAYTNDIKLPREFGIRCKEIINDDFLDIATIRNKRERKHIFITTPETIIAPNKGKFFFYKIF